MTKLSPILLLGLLTSLAACGDDPKPAVVEGSFQSLWCERRVACADDYGAIDQAACEDATACGEEPLPETSAPVDSGRCKGALAKLSCADVVIQVRPPECIPEPKKIAEFAAEAVGNPCGGLRACPEGAWCDGDGMSCGTCVAQVAEGESCTQAKECLSWECRDGVCAAEKMAGRPNAPCKYDDQCRSNYCTQFGVCSQTAKFEPMPKVGDKCAGSRDCDACRADGSLCLAGLACEKGRCAELPEEGDKCVDRCLDGLCVEGVCQTPSACFKGEEDDVCVSDSQCRPDFACDVATQHCIETIKSGELCASASDPASRCAGYCDYTGLCADRKGPGQECQGNEQCESSECTDGKCAEDSWCGAR